MINDYSHVSLTLRVYINCLHVYHVGKIFCQIVKKRFTFVRELYWVIRVSIYKWMLFVCAYECILGYVFTYVVVIGISVLWPFCGLQVVTHLFGTPCGHVNLRWVVNPPYLTMCVIEFSSFSVWVLQFITH